MKISQINKIKKVLKLTNQDIAYFCDVKLNTVDKWTSKRDIRQPNRWCKELLLKLARKNNIDLSE